MLSEEEFWPRIAIEEIELINKDSKYIHSKKDIPEFCSAENLNGCIEICYNAIKSLDLRVE